MKNRGQVTLFIIIAIVIVAAALITFFVIRERQRVQLEQQAQVQEIKTFATNCLEIALNKTEKELCFNGFYHEAPNDSILYFLTEVPYFYKNKTIKVPTLSKVEHEFSLAITSDINNCLNNFSSFKAQGIDILWDFSIDTEIKNGSIAAMTSPITVKKDKFVTSILVSTEKESELNSLHQLANAIVVEYGKNPGFLCVDCLDELSVSYNTTIKVSSLFAPTGEGIYIFSVTKDDLLLRFVVEA